MLKWSRWLAKRDFSPRNLLVIIQNIIQLTSVITQNTFKLPYWKSNYVFWMSAMDLCFINLRAFVYIINEWKVQFYYLYIYISWPFPPVWGSVVNAKKATKPIRFYSVLQTMTRDPAEFGRYCWTNPNKYSTVWS